MPKTGANANFFKEIWRLLSSYIFSRRDDNLPGGGSSKDEEKGGFRSNEIHKKGEGDAYKSSKISEGDNILEKFAEVFRERVGKEKLDFNDDYSGRVKFSSGYSVPFKIRKRVFYFRPIEVDCAFQVGGTDSFFIDYNGVNNVKKVEKEFLEWYQKAECSLEKIKRLSETGNFSIEYDDESGIFTIVPKEKLIVTLQDKNEGGPSTKEDVICDRLTYNLSMNLILAFVDGKETLGWSGIEEKEEMDRSIFDVILQSIENGCEGASGIFDSQEISINFCEQ